MRILLSISFSVSLLGILLLLFLSNSISPELTDIKEISKKSLDEKIKIQGKIQKIINFQDYNFQIIYLEDKTGKINVVLDKKTELSANQSIIVIGRVAEYKKELQVQADKIVRV